MSRFALVRHILASTGGNAVAYDTRFGTDSPTTIVANAGWFTFGLNSGNRRIWLDSKNGSDANNGLTAANAVKTPTRMYAVFNTGWTSGDQIMVAGGESQTYTDPHDLVNCNWRYNQGISATYPSAMLCYDSTDASNSAKYGKLLGSNKPRWIFTAANTLFDLPGDNTGHHYAVQGIDFDTQGAPDITTNIVGRHDNLCFQNCRLNGFSLAFDATSSTHGKSQNMNISKCSAWNTWSPVNGNNSFIFSAKVYAMWVQDCVIIHSGFPIFASRDDGVGNGGATFLGHGIYYPAGANAARFDRNFYADNECDGWGMRGDATATQLFSMDGASGEVMAHWSGSYTEMPTGATVTVDDFGICGAARELSSTANPEGGGIATYNLSVSGSHINNGVFFDNPFPDSPVINFQTSNSAGQVLQHVDISNVRVHNYAPNKTVYYYPQSTNTVSWTFTNCLFDTLATVYTSSAGPNASGTNVRVWAGGDYPNASFNRAALISGLGFSSKAALFNAMLAYPHLPWAQACLALSFSAFGTTPIYATASVPSIAGLPTPEIVYKTTLNDLTVSSTFVRTATPAISSITLAGSVATVTTASAHGLSTGKQVVITGTAQTPNDSTTFDTQGVATITVTGANTFTYVPPNKPTQTSASTVGSYKQGLLLQGNGVNSTFSATGLEAGMTLTGRAIAYDGTGSGPFSTINVTETNSDGAGTHTTTGLVIG